MGDAGLGGAVQRLVQPHVPRAGGRRPLRLRPAERRRAQHAVGRGRRFGAGVGCRGAETWRFGIGAGVGISGDSAFGTVSDTILLGDEARFVQRRSSSSR